MKCQCCGAIIVSAASMSSSEADLLRHIIATNPPHAELHEIASRIGGAATFILLEAHGGQRIHMPRRLEGSKLARLLGPDAARALANWRGAEDVKIPLGRCWRIKVWRLWGASYGSIARHFRITEKAVHANLAALRMTSRERARQSPSRSVKRGP